MGSANLVEESEATAHCVHITGIENRGRTISILVRGSNKLMLDEAERSLHDALCVIRCLVKKRYVNNWLLSCQSHFYEIKLYIMKSTFMLCIIV